MRHGDEELQVLAEIASDAARRAGALIRASRPQLIERKSSMLSPAAQVVTEVDRAAQDCILDVLGPTFEPHALALLTEEADDDGGRLEKDRFWCIDPLDGTLPYVEREPGYAVSIALVSRAGEPLVGVVYAPASDTLYRAVRGRGAWRNDARLVVGGGAPSSTLSVYADWGFDAHPRRAELLAGFEAVARGLSLEGVEVHTRAGGVLNACGVIERAPACYCKLPKTLPGGGSLWDFAATACLAHEAGAIATDFFGAPLDLNRADGTFMNHRGVMYASDARLAECLRQHIHA